MRDQASLRQALSNLIEVRQRIRETSTRPSGAYSMTAEEALNILSDDLHLAHTRADAAEALLIELAAHVLGD